MPAREKVLLVEDEEYLPDAWKEQIESVGDASTQVLIARCYREAVAEAQGGDIAYCVLDLGLPMVPGGPVVEIDGDNTCDLGFRALREICQRNPFVNVIIASRFSDNTKVARIKNRLVYDEKLPIVNVVNKNEEITFIQQYVLQDVHGLQEIQPFLDGLGMRAVHFLERRLARRLWQKAGEPVAQWPTPILVLRGPARSGKDAWARAFITFLSVRQPRPDRVPHVQFDLGLLGSADAGDSAAIELFGARDYQGKAPSAGIFERATAYRRGGVLCHNMALSDRLARQEDQVDYASSNVAWLNELGNLPDNCQRLLLTVLDSNPELGGRVTPAGASGETLQVGCPIVFTTNASIEERVARSDNVGPGQIREDLYLRLKHEPRGWLYVPNLSNIGYGAFREHLLAALRRRCGTDVPIAPSAESLLREAVGRGGKGITMSTVSSIVEHFARSGATRLIDASVLASLDLQVGNATFHPLGPLDATHSTDQRALTPLETQPSVAEGEAHPADSTWSINEFEADGAVGRADKAYHILDLYLRNLGKALTIEEVMAYLDQSEELRDVREGQGWDAYANQHTAQKAASDLRRNINRPHLVDRSGIKLLRRGYGAIAVLTPPQTRR